MRKIAFLMAALLGAAGGAVAEMQTRLLNDPKFGYAGAVLESGYVYEVRSNLLGLKATVPGQSALKVRPGASVVIKFYNKATLEVKGGDAFGPLPAGAGIEVPYGAKLVLAGDGTLIATGGNAAPGGQGYGGACGLEGDIKAASAMKPEDAPIPDPKKYENYERNGVKLKDFCSEAIHWAMVGAGGDGGGGAGTGIGGRGGLGGKGGKGGEGQLVVGATQYNKRTKNYADFVKFFGIRNPYVFDGQTRVDGKYRVGSTGLDGQPGADGRGGCGCGEIIVADNVTINAISGASAAGGGNGSFGPTAKFKDPASH